ncbi:MAG: hypothetical protein M3N07_09765 [Pseudomonadota bacterium]|nr:hypothetical protein [Pseudomonadota bacterium]
MRQLLPIAACLALAACGGERNQGEKAADQLEEATDVSVPAAQPVLENGAEAIREQGGNAADAQNVLERAGNVASGLPANGQ